MNKSKQQQINSEKIALFNFLWAELEKETETIWGDCRKSRDLACSEWSFNPLFGELFPTKQIPERFDLLNKNFNKMAECNSRRKYFLIQAFLPMLKKLDAQLNTEQLAVYNYWKQEFAKPDPELDNRFNISPQNTNTRQDNK